MSRRSSKKSPYCRLSLNGLLFLGLVEVLFFHLYYWDYTVSMISSTTIYAIDAIAEPIVHNLIMGDNGLDASSNVTEILERTSKAKPYKPFGPLELARVRNNTSFNDTYSKADMDSNVTLQVLQNMGTQHSELADSGLLQQLPPWWRVVENFGHEPVILGMERCQAYRTAVPAEQRQVGPTGLFSTGTNVLQSLLYQNCLPPLEHQKNRRKFQLWQAPWGKHNPESARLHHIAYSMQHKNQSSVLPIVTVRHPYSWLYALCQHPYTLTWDHNRDYCDRSLFLKHMVSARYGAMRSQASNIPKLYPSLMHVWRDWNMEYFQQVDYPLLMVRLEDLVYRPKEVVTQICKCAGGRLTEDFEYRQESANLGRGHGEHRSDLLSAFVKYGRPLSMFQNMYTKRDWSIIRDVLNHDHGIMEALRYKV